MSTVLLRKMVYSLAVLVILVGCGTTTDDDGTDDTGDDETDDTGDDDTDDTDDDDTGGDFTLSNNPEGCADPFFVSPYVDEEGNWAATRLTPPGYPFEVTQIEYTLPAEEFDPLVCNTTLEHTVRLFTGESTEPAAEPTMLAEFVVPAGGTAGEERLIELAVEPVVTIVGDEHLFVIIQFTGEWPDVLCLPLCQDDGGEADRNYWSITDEVPYEWQQLASWNINSNFVVEAHGSY